MIRRTKSKIFMNIPSSNVPSLTLSCLPHSSSRFSSTAADSVSTTTTTDSSSTTTKPIIPSSVTSPSRKRLNLLVLPSSLCSKPQSQQSPPLTEASSTTPTPLPAAVRSATPAKKGPKGKRSPSPVQQSVVSPTNNNHGNVSASAVPSSNVDAAISEGEKQHKLLEASQEELTRLQQQVPLRKMSAALAEKKEHDKKVLSKGTEMMSNLPTIIKVFEKLDPDTRRYIVVAAASEEWFGTPQVKTKLKEADALSDQRICATDYEQWIATSMRKRMEAIPRAHFWTLVAFFGAPFFAMGCLDNCVFILSGDVFDRLLWEHFGVSGMLCAGLGGIVAGMVGLQVHGVAARVMSKTIRMPETTNAQRMSSSYTRAKHWGGVFGLCVGLSFGTLPVFFLAGRDDR